MNQELLEYMADSNRLTILITIDCLRLDCVIESVFELIYQDLKRDFLSFSNAYSHGVATPFAFPALIAGQLPQGDGSLGDSPRINEFFGISAARSNNVHLDKDAGYEKGWTHWGGYSSSHRWMSYLKEVVSSSDILRNAYYKTRSIATHRLNIDLHPPYATADMLVDDLKKTIRGQRPDLVWSHFMDPHYPFIRGAVRDRDITTASQYSAGDLEHLNSKYVKGEVTEEEIDILIKLYIEKIKFMDRQLGNFFQWLKDEDLYKNSSIVITSDHGEVFGECGFYNHQWDADPIDELINVPLFVKPSGLEHGNMFDRNVCHLQVYDSIRRRIIDTWADDPPFEEERIISKSNSSIRITTPDGYIIKRRSGELFESGNPSEDAHKIVDKQTYPHIENLGGVAPGMEIDGTVEEQLEALGYR